ncbi:hypothetical protein GN958_ATG08396 [Phytophthora infestans]|uniref:Uncharacterized protein n=1 Tax=Phytophthora infestans TaxID=4787 RepID=A0A8S9UNF7_PHYIN|nr:hypothetical protein GN958_ATG08396 [Phytophthora infestans]
MSWEYGVCCSCAAPSRRRFFVGLPHQSRQIVSYLVNQKYVYTGWKVGKPQHICSDCNMRSTFRAQWEDQRGLFNDLV